MKVKIPSSEVKIVCKIHYSLKNNFWTKAQCPGKLYESPEPPFLSKNPSLPNPTLETLKENTFVIVALSLSLKLAQSSSL